MPETSNQNPFIHLRVHSAYSLAEGAIKVKKLVELCKQNDMPAVAVTDTNNMFGAMEFAVAAAKEGVQPIIGAQANIDDGHIALLATNEQGYRNLCRLISDAHMEGDGSSDPAISLKALQEFNAGLICLTGAHLGPIGQRVLHGQLEEAEKYLLHLKSLFGDRLYI